ncbi:MAG: hypothetical protein M3157_07620, partial [Actinomycetota bacterium]|nr:hypothetical protein [Actinomycetota bacterium]
EDRVAVRLGECEGSLVPKREEVLLELHCLRAPESVRVAGEEVDWRYDEEDRRLTVSLQESPAETLVEVLL